MPRRNGLLAPSESAVRAESPARAEQPGVPSPKELKGPDAPLPESRHLVISDATGLMRIHAGGRGAAPAPAPMHRQRRPALARPGDWARLARAAFFGRPGRAETFSSSKRRRMAALAGASSFLAYWMARLPWPRSTQNAPAQNAGTLLFISTVMLIAFFLRAGGPRRARASTSLISRSGWAGVARGVGDSEFGHGRRGGAVRQSGARW